MTVQAFVAFMVGFVLVLACLPSRSIQFYEYINEKGVIVYTDQPVEGVEPRDTDDIDFSLTEVQKVEKKLTRDFSEQESSISDPLSNHIQIFRERRQIGDRNIEVWVYHRNGVEIGVSETLGAIEVNL
jgi:hypothetical protein